MKELKLLGFKVRDVVTGSEGIATSIAFDLYGCVQVLVNPGVGKDGKPGDLQWFDHKRLIRIGKRPVMPVPTFAVVPGGERLPLQS